MTDRLDTESARAALANLPEGVSYDEDLAPEQVYLPPSHLKAMDPNSMLVTGMRGAGKTFWWAALQQSDVRKAIHQITEGSALSENTEVRTGFGIRPALDQYPGQGCTQSPDRDWHSA